VPDRRHPKTLAVHAGVPAPAPGEPFLPGPAFASAYHLAGPVDAAPYGYARYANPTWTAYERALGELEGGEAVLFASGMAAVAAVLLPGLRPGDAVVVPDDGYPGARDLAREHLAPRSIEVRAVPTDEAQIRAALPGAAMLWLESPSNPLLDVVDLSALALAGREAGALVVVDNTLATPLGQRPLELGAHISVSSGSKHVTGHSDLIMGWVAARERDHLDAVRTWRGRTGAIPGPFEAWLAHRSLPTLALRLEQSAANALALARLLAGRADVGDVRYPGLEAHPGHDLAARQMATFGTVLGFDAGSAPRAQDFLARCELVFEATSFGGVHSSAERRARWGTDAVPEGFIRLSAGCEHSEDLLADVAQALDATA
jgi:cystathionine gamma-lyase